ncbi:MAG: hypothetical protein AB8B48_20195 [Pseudomonadales bacterium]
MISKTISISCCTALVFVSIAGLIWAQDSVADIEFLEFLANWSEEEQYWLESELDKEFGTFAENECGDTTIEHAGDTNPSRCEAVAIDEEGVQ